MRSIYEKFLGITDEILKQLNSKYGKTATIMIPWDTAGIEAHKGGYLADFEYAIAPQEMKANDRKADPSTTRCGKL